MDFLIPSFQGPGTASFVASFPPLLSQEGGGGDVLLWATRCSIGGPMRPDGTGVSPRPRNAASTLVRIISPTAGQVFSPLQSIPVSVQVDPSLNAVGGILFTDTLGISSPTAISPTSLTFSVPAPYPDAGEVTLTPTASDANGKMTFGEPVVVSIMPSNAPVQVTLGEHNFRDNLTDSGEELSLTGTYADGTVLDLTGSVTGTTYTTSDPTVVKVDSEGNFTFAGPGIASITAKNSGFSDYASFVVEDPQHPLPALEVTGSFSFPPASHDWNPSGAILSFHQAILPIDGAVIPGPLFALVYPPRGMSFLNADGVTVNTEPGTPFIWLTLPGQGLVITPGEATGGVFEFAGPYAGPRGFGMRVFFAASQVP
jgi:hypothetical protein